MAAHARKGKMSLRDYGRELEARRAAVRAALAGKATHVRLGRHGQKPTPGQLAAITLAIIERA